MCVDEDDESGRVKSGLPNAFMEDCTLRGGDILLMR